MNENANELKTVITILSRLSVSGDAVDLMAAAKQKIRNVIAELEKPEKPEQPNEGGEN